MDYTTSFVTRGPDRLGRIAILKLYKWPEGTRPTARQSRLICEVEPQQTAAETERIADNFVKVLNDKTS